MKFDFPVTLKDKGLDNQGLCLLWRWPESNRCPNIFVKSFLHAYFSINCREGAGAEKTNIFLSCIVLSNRHSLRLQQPVSFWFRRSNAVQTNLLSRPKWVR